MAQDIVGAIHVRMDPAAIGRDEGGTRHAPTAVGGMFADGFQVKERAFRGVAFFLDQDLDPGQFGFVGQQADEGGVRDGDELLVVDLPEVDTLLPAHVLANHQHAHAFAPHPVDDVATGPMQVVLDLAVALVGQRLQWVGGVLPRGQLGLQGGAPLVVIRVDALERSAINQKGR